MVGGILTEEDIICTALCFNFSISNSWPELNHVFHKARITHSFGDEFIFQAFISAIPPSLIPPQQTTDSVTPLTSQPGPSLKSHSPPSHAHPVHFLYTPIFFPSYAIFHPGGLWSFAEADLVPSSAGWMCPPDSLRCVALGCARVRVRMGWECPCPMSSCVHAGFFWGFGGL